MAAQGSHEKFVASTHANGAKNCLQTYKTQNLLKSHGDIARRWLEVFGLIFGCLVYEFVSTHLRVDDLVMVRSTAVYHIIFFSSKISRVQSERKQYAYTRPDKRQCIQGLCSRVALISNKLRLYHAKWFVFCFICFFTYFFTRRLCLSSIIGDEEFVQSNIQ